MIAVQAAFYLRALNEGVVEEQHPPVVLPARAVVGLSAQLSRRIRHQRAVSLYISADAIGQIFRKLPLKKQAEDIKAVQ